MRWVTNDNRKLTLQQLETTHIRNSIARIRRSMKSLGKDPVDGKERFSGWRIEWLRPLLDELKRRELADRPDLNPARLTNRFRNLDLD